jgi:hypothetical protein
MAELKVKAQATQEFVPLKEVRDGIVILKDGSLRALLMASSINLALKSGDEQQLSSASSKIFLTRLSSRCNFLWSRATSTSGPTSRSLKNATPQSSTT